MKISVVLTTVDRREYLHDAVRSVLSQTLSDWELLIVDDCSTDDTPQYLARLSDPRIRIFTHSERRMQPGARNTGLTAAQAESILFLDDDDVLRPDALERLSRALADHPEAVAVVGGLRFIEQNLDTTLRYHPSKPVTGFIWRELLFNWWANSGQALYRTKAVRDFGGFDPSVDRCLDRKLWLQLARRWPVTVFPEVVLEYRQHAGQDRGVHIEVLRQKVWNEFIDGLPIEEQSTARGIRHSARHLTEPTLLGLLQLAIEQPYFLRSPLTNRPLWWTFKNLLLGRPPQ